MGTSVTRACHPQASPNVGLYARDPRPLADFSGDVHSHFFNGHLWLTYYVDLHVKKMILQIYSS
jgi:hypothetical protein